MSHYENSQLEFIAEDSPDYIKKWICEDCLEARKDRDEARGVCAEAYQVLAIVGNLHESTIPMLDNLSAVANGQKPPHETCLPYFPPADNPTPDRETIRELGREAADRLNEGETLAIRDLDGSEKWYRVVKVTPSGLSGQELTLDPLDADTPTTN